MAITAGQVAALLAQDGAEFVPSVRVSVLLAERANQELRAWGHDGHDVILERAEPFYGDPGQLRCVFWCKTCNVPQVALIPRPAAG